MDKIDSVKKRFLADIENFTIENDKKNRGNFFLQKDNEKRQSLSALQARMTYHQLIEFGYKLQKPKKKKAKSQVISEDFI